MGSQENGEHSSAGKVSRRRRSSLYALAFGILALILALGLHPPAAPVFSSILSFKGFFRCPHHSTKQALSGVVEDCKCDYETVDRINTDIVYPTLQELVKTPFFRYFKVKLWCDCPFWPDDGMCRLRDCSVCECPEDEFPDSFKGRPGGQLQLSWSDPKCQEGKPQAAVDRTLDNKVFQGWTETDNPWTHDNETDNAEMTYVNLRLNPERYTGYVGDSAHRIWNEIYRMNCFKDSHMDVCAEKRLFYKLISGLHSSITIHIAADYLLDESAAQWGPNITILEERVNRYPERVKNLYVSFLFVLRAVNKAAEFLTQAEYNTGNASEDSHTQEAVASFVTNKQLHKACPVPFDEAQLWRGVDGTQRKSELQQHFRKISALMDCVGCEKCRLWGKLQILGFGTAFKILFSEEASLNLQRNEVIALINLLSRLSESLRFLGQHR